jgi:hypothetical protein
MNNNNTSYSSIIPNEHESGSSGESLRIFDSPYTNYSSHYPDYPTASKLEAFDYNYWTPTTTNILTNPSNPILDQMQTPSSSSSSSNQQIEPHVPVSSVHLSHINSSTTISSTHHHHHIHQHLYPPPSPPPITCNDPTTWLGSGDYQPLHSTTNPSSYRHYSTPCSFYPPNNFYDPSQSHWTPPPPLPSTLPIKFESPYSPPPSYYQSSDSLNHCQEQMSKEEPRDSPPEQLNWHKHPTSSNQLIPIPPKNPLTGNQLTFKLKNI